MDVSVSPMIDLSQVIDAAKGRVASTLSLSKRNMLQAKVVRYHSGTLCFRSDCCNQSEHSGLFLEDK